MKGSDSMMGVQEYLEILRNIRDCAFATIDCTGAPTVRIIDVMLVEEGRLYFCTARGKNFYAELMANPAVAVTGLNKEWQTVRLMGRVESLLSSAIIAGGGVVADGTSYGTRRKACGQRAEGDDRPYLSGESLDGGRLSRRGALHPRSLRHRGGQTRISRPRQESNLS